MAVSRKDRQREFLASVALNTRRLGCKSGVSSVEQAIKKEWPHLPDKLPGVGAHYEKKEPLPKFKRLADPEEIDRINRSNDRNV